MCARLLLERCAVVKHAGHRIRSARLDERAVPDSRVPGPRPGCRRPRPAPRLRCPVECPTSRCSSSTRLLRSRLGSGSAGVSTTSADFFVAGRRLGPGLIFSTMLAANIGAGSTVGATALGYSDGLAGVWWVGSAALGLDCAGTVDRAGHPACCGGARLPHGRGFPRVPLRRCRSAPRSPRCCGSAPSSSSPASSSRSPPSSHAIAGVPPAAGCAVGGLLITIYFTAGGLLTSAWVNVVQLTVKLAGFAVALPLALRQPAGGTRCARCSRRPTTGTCGRVAVRADLPCDARPGVRHLARPAAEDLRRARRSGRPSRGGRQRRSAWRCMRWCRS